MKKTREATAAEQEAMDRLMAQGAALVVAGLWKALGLPALPRRPQPQRPQVEESEIIDVEWHDVKEP